MIDDLMASRPPRWARRLSLVVNASRKEIDFAHIAGRLPAAREAYSRTGSRFWRSQGPKSRERSFGNDPQAWASSCFMKKAAPFALASMPSASPVPAIRARMASRFPSRREDAERACPPNPRLGPMSCQSVLARAIRCGSKRAFAFMGRTWTRRCRPSRRGSPSRLASAGARKGGSPGCRAASSTSFLKGPVRFARRA